MTREVYDDRQMNIMRADEKSAAWRISHDYSEAKNGPAI